MSETTFGPRASTSKYFTKNQAGYMPVLACNATIYELPGKLSIDSDLVLGRTRRTAPSQTKHTS